MRRFAGGFLRFVGLEYIALGLIGLAALFEPSGNLLGLPALGMSLLLVAPLPLTMENGLHASCFERSGRTGGCNLDPAVIEHARTVLIVLCVLSLLGGLLGVWGASTRNKRAGQAVWLTLTAISVAVALWNLKWFFFDSFASNPLIGAVSAFWALTYAAAYLRALRNAD
jgi:hypothetical protein